MGLRMKGTLEAVGRNLRVERREARDNATEKITKGLGWGHVLRGRGRYRIYWRSLKWEWAAIRHHDIPKEWCVRRKTYTAENSVPASRAVGWAIQQSL